MLRGDKAQPNFGLSENMVQPIENIRNPKNRVSEYFIPDGYKIEGQTSSSMKSNICEKGGIYFPLLFFIAY